ncbi:amidotransferase [Methanospirillum lacunae]|uniref:Amidotransferase n=2 Tax=Methanospirillum lacunae TaxID=668570 RepID=A0A2V2NCG5_9EURY|nr:amidotransferase [Methanospirillum lacunae]
MSFVIVQFLQITSHISPTNMIQIFSLEHAPHEDPVYITQWLHEKQINLQPVRLYEGDHFPDVAEVGILLIMGGFMNIYEEKEFPWLVEEKKFIRKVIDAGKPVLGICLGGQLIADILGEKVTKALHPEYGWHTINRVTPLLESSYVYPERLFALFPEKVQAFEWHQDTFAIPEGAVRIYASKLCENQAYLYHDRVIGLQFHPEMDELTIREFLHYSSSEIKEKGLEDVKLDILERISLTSSGNLFVAGLMEYLLELA